MVAGYLGGAGRTEAIDCAVGANAAACPGGGTAGTGGSTYGDLGKIDDATPGEEHVNGEIWGQTLWDLRARVGVRTARCIVTGGLRLSPENPDFLQARDAILQSALVVGVAQGPVWEVFAARGMGANATTPGYNSLDVTEDFTVPAGLPQPPAPTGSCADPPPVDTPGGGTKPPAGGTNPPGGPGGGSTAEELASALTADLRAALRSLARSRIGKLVRRRRFAAVSFNALTAGRVTIALKAKPPRGRASGAAAVTLAGGSRRVTTAGRYQVRVKLTRKGVRLLRRARRLRVTVSLRFVPASGTALGRTGKLTLRR
jgi:hypothetical protein